MAEHFPAPGAAAGGWPTVKFNSQAELAHWAREASGLILFLDYDGTLVDFSPTPDELDPNPQVISLLEKLAQSPTITTAVISGRKLDNLRRLLPVAGLWLGGTYGLELQPPSGEILYRANLGEVRPELVPIKSAWQSLIAGRSGFFLEDKGFALALHARFAEEGEAAEVLAAAQRALDNETLGERFRILGGVRFLEVALRQASKRAAVAFLLEQPRFRPGSNRQDLRGTLPRPRSRGTLAQPRSRGTLAQPRLRGTLARLPQAGARLLYIGDDDRDEEAFPLVHEHGGAAVKVAQPTQAGRPTEADFIFASPEETVDWLNNLVEH